MGIAALIGLLASLVGTGISVYQGNKNKEEVLAAQEKQRKLDETLALKAAMARALGVDNRPYENPNIKMPEPPDTTVANTISGIGGAVSNAASSNWADKMFSSTPKTPTSSVPSNYNYNSYQEMPYYG